MNTDIFLNMLMLLVNESNQSIDSSLALVDQLVQRLYQHYVRLSADQIRANPLLIDYPLLLVKLYQVTRVVNRFALNLENTFCKNFTCLFEQMFTYMLSISEPDLTLKELIKNRYTFCLFALESLELFDEDRLTLLIQQSAQFVVDHVILSNAWNFKK